MKAVNTSKNLKEMPYPPQRKALKKKRKNYYTYKDKCPNFKNVFRMPKINNSNLSNEKKELKMKLGQLHIFWQENVHIMEDIWRIENKG